jgi:class 3 adenylate cyclase
MEELFDAAILFTDMCGSSELVTSTSAREFFGILNESLSTQSRIVRDCQGRVLKYIGDGLMAIFRGPDRAAWALKCACALAHPAFGIGVAEGRVAGGIVGGAVDEPHLRQYDVIGACVHLASRLCTMADAGEVLATRHVVDASGLLLPLRDVGPVRVRGFPAEIDCVAIVQDVMPCAASSSA